MVPRWGSLVIAARLKLGISQSELARRVGVSQAYMSRIESGDKPDADVAKRIAQTLKIKEPK